MEVPVLDAKILKDAEHFYRLADNKPVIVRNVTETAIDLNFAEIEQLFRPCKLFCYDRRDAATGTVRKTIQGDEFFDLLNDEIDRFYVFDHGISATPLDGHVKMPKILGNNWIEKLCPSYSLNVTISCKGSFTPFHEDSSGMQAFMHLLVGEKEWDIYSPKARPLLYNFLTQSFYNPKKHGDGSETHPFVNLVPENLHYKVTAKAGDLIHIPPGWIHQVKTTEKSFGIGGNIVNEYQAALSTETALVEHSTGLLTSFSIYDLLLDAKNTPKTEYGYQQMQQAMNLVELWVKETENKLNPRPLSEISWPYFWEGPLEQ